MSDNKPHQSYQPPAISEVMPSGFSYLRPNQMNGGVTGQERVSRYQDTGDDSGDD